MNPVGHAPAPEEDEAEAEQDHRHLLPGDRRRQGANALDCGDAARPHPVNDDPPTIWSMIHGAAAGDGARRSAFAERYLPLVKSYLATRWRGTQWIDALEDATQEVFVECLRGDGVLERADSAQPGGFRAFLFGAIRNVARRHEQAVARARARVDGVPPGPIASRDDSLDTTFDREWARCLVRQASAEQHRVTALVKGAVAREGVELLRLRFEENLPIRAIAARWGVEPATVHRRYRQARAEFRQCLRKVVAFHHPNAADLDRECADLLALLAGD